VVQAGQPVLRLARRGALEAVVQVPETRLAEFTPTAEFRVSVNALGDAEYHARLVEFSPQADAATRTYTAKLGLEAKPELRLGMSVRVAPTSPVAGNALLIPAAALYSRSNQAQVWVIDAKTSTVRLVPVLTAGLRGEHVLVRQGLQPGDRIVAAGGNLLNAGQRVRPVEIKS
jgi:RND family efflux transporter MFP subunit